ncbi:methyl-accepting chemotaxis protein [Pseudoalteromonas sp. C2R02]|uniref:methyl-accepting chemotaxis protein n=1 Tax=Pseudoalteromonas sp. C2R02 TaxID=2841565 RepID=UPI001C08DBE9|nr:methyl-accepting chemotaxis protein [Pseudoalteromonas sp. C2R02]MBU2970940.1 methyl-accepting chemotaxis protein [Pseudoalteromonas sp. C2R02]
MKFVHKIAGASSALLFITILLLNTTQYLNVKAQLETTIEESITDIVNGVKNTVASELSGKKSLAKYATNMVEENPTHAHITNVISQPHIKEAFLLIGGGYESDGSHFKSDPSWDPGNGWDPRKRPWYIDAKNEQELIITDPYADSATGEILISVATPIMQARNFMGAIFFDLSLSSLSDLVNSVKLFDAGYVFIVTEKGTVIAHPEGQYNGKNMSNFLPSGNINSNQIQHVMIDDIEYDLKFVKIPEQDWYVGVVLNDKIAYQSVYSMRNNAIVYGFIALIVSVLLLPLLMKKLLKPLDCLNEAIKDVASGNGDLTKRLQTDTDKEFAELAGGFNTFTSNLQAQVTRLKATGKDILNGTEVMEQGALSSDEAMSTQLQEIELLATAMHQMATTASDVATNARNAASAAQEAEDSTQKGSDIVKSTTSSIEALSHQIEQAVSDVVILEEAAHSIETVLQVINDIAEQTNLLALNAAIEAARAGEQGRGFAVVADEVRTLASRTQESTTEIRNMIDKLQAGTTTVSQAMKSSQVAASNTVEQASQTDEALNSIYAAIKLINDMNLQIASAANEQSTVAEEINTNTVRIKDLSISVSDQNHKTVDAIQLQTAGVREQNDILEKFKV